MPEPTLFDIQEGTAQRDAGMDRAARSRWLLLAMARDFAKMVALSRSSRIATADDVMESLKKLGYEPKRLGNAAGSIFRGKEWEFVGWVNSTRPTNHARPIRVWRLR